MSATTWGHSPFALLWVSNAMSVACGATAVSSDHASPGVNTPPAPRPEVLVPCIHAEDQDVHDRSCVPTYIRGRQLLRDDRLGIRAFEACELRGWPPAQAVESVDHARVVVERMGRIRPSRDELRRLFAQHTAKMSAIPDFASGGPGGCVAGVHPVEGDCIIVRVTTAQPELSTLVSDVADAFDDVGDTCVPVVVEVGQQRRSFL